MCGRKETTYFLYCLETKRQRESQQFLIDFVKPRNAVKGFFMLQTSPSGIRDVPLSLQIMQFFHIVQNAFDPPPPHSF